MEVVRAYLFWIICAVILLVEIIIMAMITPEAGTEPGLGAEEAKRRAEQQYRQHIENDLLRRAHRTRENEGPPNPIERSVDRIQEVLDGFVVTHRWSDRLSQAIEHHRRQLAEIKTDLVRRCAWLHAPFPQDHDGPVGDVVEWYGLYKEASAAILKQAIDGGIVVAPEGIDITDDTLAENGQLRSLIGLYTDPTTLLANQQRQAVLHMRLTQTVVEALTQTKGRVLPNPLLEGDYGDWSLAEQRDARARIIEWEWEAPGRAGARRAGREEAVVPDYGRPYVFTLTLQGPPAALLAGAAAIDVLSRPPFVRLGSSWQRHRARRSADRRQGAQGIHVSEALDESMHLELRYAALDFAEVFKGDPTVSADAFEDVDVMPVDSREGEP